MNSKLDEHTPLKRIDKYKLKFKSKPWRTPAIQKSVIVKKKKKSKRFINAKCSQTNDHRQYRDFRNMLSTL